MRLTLIQLRTFEARWRSEGLRDEDLQRLESGILADPDIGAVIAGTGGLRKMRFAPRSRGKGKSGSFRVCYAHFPQFNRIYLVTLYPKSVQANLSQSERNAMKALMQRISFSLQRGENP